VSKVEEASRRRRETGYDRRQFSVTRGSAGQRIGAEGS
jgi:hypothetical protein